mgnify:CR=1 FL=1
MQVGGGGMNLTHLDENGAARMVDVGEKAVSARMARAQAEIVMQPETLRLICAGRIEKGDVFSCARIAGTATSRPTATSPTTSAARPGLSRTRSGKLPGLPTPPNNLPVTSRAATVARVKRASQRENRRKKSRPKATPLSTGNPGRRATGSPTSRDAATAIAATPSRPVVTATAMATVPLMQRIAWMPTNRAAATTTTGNVAMGVTAVRTKTAPPPLHGAWSRALPESPRALSRCSSSASSASRGGNRPLRGQKRFFFGGVKGERKASGSSKFSYEPLS